MIKTKELSFRTTLCYRQAILPEPASPAIDYCQMKKGISILSPDR